MRNLINFIYRYHVALLFLVLEVVGFSLLVSYNTYQGIRWFNWSGEFTGSIYNTYHDLTAYLSLKEANEQLAQENAALRSRLREAYLSETANFNPVIDSAYQQHYEFIAAEVIQGSRNKRDNYLVLNKGSVHGIQPEMGVVGPNGVVGVVTEVSDHYATVMSLLHSQSQISSKLAKNEYFGLVSWNGLDYRHAQLNDIPAHVELVNGDTLVTRGASGIFPEGKVVGYVDTWQLNPSTNFYEIEMVPATNFARVYHVQVIRNLYKFEIDALNDNLEENDE